MRRLLSAILLSLALLAPSGCSTNPATGEQSFTGFMSRADELEIGKKEHPKILKELGGAYDDRELAAYVHDIGWALARASEVPDMPWTFTLLNTDTVNAFAVPGGYVYITRGLLALADNEAEMASVIAHEIGHITARHTAQRYSQAVAANLGLAVLGAVGSTFGVPGEVGRLVSFGTQAYLQSYSREQELEADMLGVRYMTRAGYDPRASIDFLTKLGAQNKLEAALRGEPEAAERFSIFATHPRTAQRVEQAIQLAKVTPVADPRFARGAFLRRIDGMIYGDDPEQGVRVGRVFAHPSLGFRFEVPPGFYLINSPRQVAARGPEGALILFDMEAPKKARDVKSLTAYLTRTWGRGISLRDVERIEVNGLDGATGHTRISNRQGSRDLRLIAIRDGPERIFRFAFLTPPALTAGLGEDLRRTTYSFRNLTQKEIDDIQPLRVRIVVVEPGDTAESLAEAMPFEKFRLELFETLNGLGRGESLQPGSVVKVIGT